MRFPLEVVVAGKQDNTSRIHIKYADHTRDLGLQEFEVRYYEC